MSHSDIQKAAEILKNGGTVVFPTETVYGIGACSDNPLAVARVFEVKGRPRFNPLIVHLASQEFLADVVEFVPEPAQTLVERFWPGPLTLVLPKKESVPSLVCAGLSTVAVRMPQHPIAQQLLKAVGKPVAAPSANRFSRLSPTRVEHAQAQLGKGVDFYLDGGPCSIGVESTIVGWIDDKLTLLRRGGLPVEEIESVVGPLASAPQGGKPLAPGQLRRHYAPKTPLLFSDKPVVFGDHRRVGLLALKPSESEKGNYTQIAYLSESGDLKEAAHRLFSQLEEFETQSLDLIVARPFPNQGLGAAINDRLRRAGAGD